ncbi:MAG: helix-turn-helix domain-containing protein [Planctomycetes bacterium]|nr:helix-turn-helix domain-containing protein [Planctomycetota bacterium]
MDQQELIRIATVVMTDLEKIIGETIGLGFLNRSLNPPMIQVLSAVEGTSGFSFHINPGYHIPIHPSAPGKAILSQLPSKDQKEVLSQLTLNKFTDNTITSMDQFKKELASCKEKGYSIDYNEQMLNCHCVGVPIPLDDASDIIAIWTTGPADSIPQKFFPQVAQQLQESANEILSHIKTNNKKLNNQYINLTIDNAIKLMENSLNKQLDIKKMAEELFVSYSWFRQAFKRRTGSSPNQYHLNLRFDKAKEDLANSNILIKDIVTKLGFNDQSYFSAYFKKKEGISPQAYRDKHQ